jgi:hypothetical protein
MSFMASSYHMPSIREMLKDDLTKSDCSMSGDGQVAGKPRKQKIIVAYALNTGSKTSTAVRFVAIGVSSCLVIKEQR